jgi:hypothetical protein
MDAQLTLPDFDGSTYDRARDQKRLNRQLDKVFHIVKHGKWITLSRIAEVTGEPEASISARLRDLRKPRFGGHTIERRYIECGLFEYRMVL